MVNFIDLIQQKLELFRLEQRYTRRRNRRSTFVSEAEYVNGEYVYAPTSSYSAQVTGGSSKSGTSSATNASTTTAGTTTTCQAEQSDKSAKVYRRMSRMNLGGLDWRQGKDAAGGSKRADKRKSRISVREIQWDGGVRS